jgi:hypothetical protein
MFSASSTLAPIAQRIGNQKTHQDFVFNHENGRGLWRAFAMGVWAFRARMSKWFLPGMLSISEYVIAAFHRAHPAF